MKADYLLYVNGHTGNTDALKLHQVELEASNRQLAPSLGCHIYSIDKCHRDPSLAS
ncbi:hypothetical protein [Candidatus Doolittlea endobia]|uniref:hypothetical protein n=1 Tax=Candidatus Doolittlea endobia TaxID=1778262 RepID=UPI0013155956|nr:hypothetical protein [Candidatus Doolittlea endobia]